MKFYPWSPLAWPSLAFLALIALVVVVLRLNGFFIERAFRKDWERSIGESHEKRSTNGACV
jgi:hypothetical protein